MCVCVCVCVFLFALLFGSQQKCGGGGVGGGKPDPCEAKTKKNRSEDGDCTLPWTCCPSAPRECGSFWGLLHTRGCHKAAQPFFFFTKATTL